MPITILVQVLDRSIAIDQEQKEIWSLATYTTVFQEVQVIHFIANVHVKTSAWATHTNKSTTNLANSRHIYSLNSTRDL